METKLIKTFKSRLMLCKIGVEKSKEGFVTRTYQEPFLSPHETEFRIYTTKDPEYSGGKIIYSKCDSPVDDKKHRYIKLMIDCSKSDDPKSLNIELQKLVIKYILRHSRQLDTTVLKRIVSYDLDVILPETYNLF